MSTEKVFHVIAHVHASNWCWGDIILYHQCKRELWTVELMFPIIQMLCCDLFIFCHGLYHWAFCLWPVKDEPTAEKKDIAERNSTGCAPVPTLHFDCIVSRDYELLVLALPAFTNSWGKAFPWWREVGRAWNCSFWRRTTSKRRFFCPWRPLLSNGKPRCQN